ncbi:hypothetical protein HYC85_006823 [Camellia sinensis]|uniref:Mitochondrial import inner membrane translocase subunit TIM50 n=1 Tax=Camellia sinensis TaxID=4442 RepID=A0A7J7HNE7_CAMSI|nr:hypothetical protein HYC85_006823 [Camellia sinensis]
MAGKLPSLKSKAVIYENSSDDDDSEDTGNDHHLGLSLEKLNLGPRKKLLVLGLGGLLVHRVYSRYGVRTNVQTRPRPDGIAGNFLVFNRPYCSEFLEFCFERFEVGIWSSAKDWNIDGVLTTIKSGLKSKLLFVWHNTAIFPDSYKVENGNDTVLGKMIDFKSWFSKMLVSRHYSDNQNNLLMLSLGPKGELLEFLGGLSDVDDVQSYVKENHVGQPAITETHAEWNYYSKIVPKFC